MTAVEQEAAPATPGRHGSFSLQLARNSLTLLVAQLVSWGLTFAVALVVPRYLGPATTGSLFLAASIVSLAALALGLGHSTLLVKLTARSPEETGRWLGNGLLIRAAIGCAMLAALPPTLLVLGYSEEVVTLTVLAGIATAIVTLGDVLSCAFQGLQWIALASMLGLAGRIISTGATIALVFAGRPVTELVAIEIPLSVLMVVVLLTILRRRGYRPSRPDPATVRMIVRGSLPFLAGGASMVVYAQLNVMLLGRLADAEAVAWYGLAMRLLGSTLFIPGILMGAAFPLLARLHATDQPAMLVQARRLLTGILICAGPMVLLLLSLGPLLVTTLYGAAFAPAGQVLQVFGVVLLALYLNTFSARLLEAMDRQRVWAVVMVAATILAVPVNIAMITWGQSLGQASLWAAYGLLITELAQTIPALIILGRLRLGGVIFGVLGKSLLALFVAGAAGLLLAPIHPIVAAATALITYVAGCWWARLVAPDELARGWSMLRHVLASRLGGWRPASKQGEK